jgi:hypothetical protein
VPRFTERFARCFLLRRRPNSGSLLVQDKRQREAGPVQRRHGRRVIARAYFRNVMARCANDEFVTRVRARDSNRGDALGGVPETQGLASANRSRKRPRLQSRDFLRSIL